MVKFLPSFIKHFKVVLTQRVRALLCGHVKVFQDDGDLHVDHHQEGHNDVRREEDYAHCRAATVPSDRRPRVFYVRVTVRRCVHDRIQQTIPSS